MNVGYGLGGRTVNDGRELNNRVSTFRVGATLVKPFAQKHAIKISFNSSIALERGPDFQAVSLVYQYRWFDKGK